MEATTIPAADANGHRRELAQIELSRMRLDPIVNRAVDPKWVDHLAGDFHPLFLGVFHVAEHDGVYKVIDGQHRKLAADKVGYDEPVAAWVYHGMSVEEQANLFLEVNMQRNVHAIDKFRKAVVAARPNEVAVAKILNDHGLEVGHNADQVGSPGALLAVVRAKVKGTAFEDGESLLRQVVTTLTGAWPNVGAGALQGELVSVVLQLVRKYRGDLDFTRLGAALSSTSPVALISDAKVKHDASPRFTRRWFISAAVVDLYNNGVESRSLRLKSWSTIS